MDWGKDYFTFSDTNIEYIWRLPASSCTSAGGSTKGHRSTEWCPRCGTSHLAARADPERRLPGSGATRRCSCASRYSTSQGESLVDLDDDALDAAGERRGGSQARRRVRTARERRVGSGRAVPGRVVRRESSRAPSSSGSATAGRSTTSGPAAEVEHRVIPWDDVSLDEGTGIVHIAPGAGQEDFELGVVHELPVLSPVDEAGRFYDSYGWLHGLSTTEAADQIVGRPRGDRVPPRGRDATNIATRTAGAATRR